MKKFWNKSAMSADIFIYGDIVSEKFFESDVTAKEFAEDLKSYGYQPVTVHINSSGGDVFTALAISNVIRDNKERVTISVDGVAASAATLIVCSGARVLMAHNARLMIHAPTVGLCGFYSAGELADVISGLESVEQSILQTYSTRTGKTVDEIANLLDSETWYTADEAKEAGFIDEITGGVIHVENKLFNKIKNFLDGRNQPQNNSSEEEVNRVRELQALRGDNEIVNSIIDTAITEGDSVLHVKHYIDAVTAADEQRTDKTAKMIVDLIQDNLDSGAEGVKSSMPAPDERTKQAELIASFAKRKG